MARAVFADGNLDECGIVFAREPVSFGIRSHLIEKPFRFAFEQQFANSLQFLCAALVDTFVQERAQFLRIGGGEFAHAGHRATEQAGGKGKEADGCDEILPH